MKKTLLAAALGLAGPLGILAVTAAPAEAQATPGCITKTEFRAIKADMPKSRVRDIVGADGRVTSSSEYSDGDGWMSLEFRQCGNSWYWSSVSIDFEKTEVEVWNSYYEWYDTAYRKPYRVTSKYAYWF